jgi:hypothetical protein
VAQACRITNLVVGEFDGPYYVRGITRDEGPYFRTWLSGADNWPTHKLQRLRGHNQTRLVSVRFLTDGGDPVVVCDTYREPPRAGKPNQRPTAPRPPTPDPSVPLPEAWLDALRPLPPTLHLLAEKLLHQLRVLQGALTPLLPPPTARAEMDGRRLRLSVSGFTHLFVEEMMALESVARNCSAVVMPSGVLVLTVDAH